MKGEGEGSGSGGRASHGRAALRSLSWPWGTLSAKCPVEGPHPGQNGQALVHCCAQRLPGSCQEEPGLSSDAPWDPAVLQLHALPLILKGDQTGTY